MSANHSDCRYAIRGDRVPVTGTRYEYIIRFNLFCAYEEQCPHLNTPAACVALRFRPRRDAAVSVDDLLLQHWIDGRGDCRPGCWQARKFPV